MTYNQLRSLLSNPVLQALNKYELQDDDVASAAETIRAIRRQMPRTDDEMGSNGKA